MEVLLIALLTVNTVLIFERLFNRPGKATQSALRDLVKRLYGDKADVSFYDSLGSHLITGDFYNDDGGLISRIQEVIDRMEDRKADEEKVRGSFKNVQFDLEVLKALTDYLGLDVTREHIPCHDTIEIKKVRKTRKVKKSK